MKFKKNWKEIITGRFGKRVEIVITNVDGDADLCGLIFPYSDSQDYVGVEGILLIVTDYDVYSYVRRVANWHKEHEEYDTTVCLTKEEFLDLVKDKETIPRVESKLTNAYSDRSVNNMNYKEMFEQGKLGVEVSSAKEYEEFMKEGRENMNYKELFEEGRLGVKVTDTKECEDFITLYGEDPNKGEWKRVVKASGCFSVVFCMYEDKLATTNGHDGDLVIIDYKKFMKETGEKMGYKKLFEQGKLGIETNNVESCKDFIKLCGEDPDNAAWKIIAAWTEYSSLIFYTNNGEIKVFDKYLADEYPVRDISYKDFIKGEEGGAYKELFKRGMLGVRVRNLKDRKDMIEKYEEINDWWKNKLNEKKNESELIFCMDEDELCLTNEEEEGLVDVIDYEEFVKEDEEETNNTNDLVNRLEKLEQEIASIKKEIMEGK